MRETVRVTEDWWQDLCRISTSYLSAAVCDDLVREAAMTLVGSALATNYKEKVKNDPRVARPPLQRARAPLIR